MRCFLVSLELLPQRASSQCSLSCPYHLVGKTTEEEKEEKEEKKKDNRITHPRHHFAQSLHLYVMSYSWEPTNFCQTMDLRSALWNVLFLSFWMSVSVSSLELSKSKLEPNHIWGLYELHQTFWVLLHVVSCWKFVSWWRLEGGWIWILCAKQVPWLSIYILRWTGEREVKKRQGEKTQGFFLWYRKSGVLHVDADWMDFILKIPSKCFCFK